MSPLPRVPLPTLPLDRLRPAWASGRFSRWLLLTVAVVLYLALALVVSGFAAVGAAPTMLTLLSINAGAVALAVLLYVLLYDSIAMDARAPLNALWRLVLWGVGLLLAYAVLPALLGSGRANPVTGLPNDLPTAALAALFGLLDASFAVVLVLTLRPLVLFRRKRSTLRVWQALLGLVLLAAFSAALTPPPEVPPLPAILFAASAALLMVYAAFRLAWIVPLPFRRKWAVIGLMAALLGLLVGILYLREQVVGAAGRFEGEAIAHAYLFSRSLGEIVTFAFVFGLLYSLTAVLSLFFHLPTSSAYEQRAGQIRAFSALAELSSEVLDRRQLAETIADAPVNAGIAQAAWLALVDPQSGSLAPRVVAADGLHPSVAARLADAEALTDAVATSGEPLLLGTATADHRVRARPGDGVGSLLVLPLTAGGQTHGALFASRTVTDGFEADDVVALGTFAGQAALALSHASLFADVLEKERLARELALAREVQQRLLPQHLPQPLHTQVAAAEHSAHEVCGDYYDVVDLGDGCWGFLVADVSGKGAAAAFYMAEFKGIVQSAAPLTRSPGEFLARANEVLARSLGPGAFISAVYGVLDTASGRFTLARAGHCPVVMRRPEGSGGTGGGIWLLRADGLGLGLDDGPIFRRTLHEQSVRLHPGDTFALYTDGLVEARNDAGDEYGYDRLQETVRAHDDDDAESLLTALLSDRHEFTAGAPHHDDLTVLVLRWLGSGTTSETTATPPDPSIVLLGEPPVTNRPVFA